MTLTRSLSMIVLATAVLAISVYLVLTQDFSTPQAILGKASVVPGILGKA